MAARLDSAAKHLCELSGWKLSNLEMQKLLYVAQMNYMGQHDGERLVETDFQAWDNGPVSPELYHKLKAFGSSRVKDVFANARKFALGSPRAAVLGRVYRRLGNLTGGALIEITHWDHGAWAKNYVPGVKGIRIPDSQIYREYRDRGKLGASVAA